MPHSDKPIVGIIGSRDITTLNLDLFIDKNHVGEVVSGGANGVDKIAEDWAKRNKIEFIAMLPNYKLYGGHWAPLKRDEDIVNYCDLIICF
jgi:predicted Rossmann fold nucleotide-binding protein DprA/Smf involved in DNA uptake